jgi:hypothetical protein
MELPPLEYGGYGKPRSLNREAIVALAVGLCSGPVSVSLVWLAALIGLLNTWPDVGILLLVVGHAGALWFCVSVYHKLKDSDAQHGRGLALGGIIATIVWAVGIILFIAFILNNLDPIQ